MRLHHHSFNSPSTELQLSLINHTTAGRVRKCQSATRFQNTHFTFHTSPKSTISVLQTSPSSKKQHPRNPSLSCYVGSSPSRFSVYYPTSSSKWPSLVQQQHHRNNLFFSSTFDLQLPDIPPIVVGRGPFSSRSCTTSASCVVIT